jgi:hypothetical protein
MLGIFRRAALAGSVVVSLVVSAITPALAATPTAALTFNPSSTSFAVGSSFTVPAQINVQNGGIFGYQFGITYDPTVLTLTSFTDGTFLSNFAATQPGQPNPNQNCKQKHEQDWTPPFPAGISQIGADILTGVCGPGASGTGTLVTFNFTANAGVNALTTINFTPSDSSGLNTTLTGVDYQNVTVAPVTLTIGAPPPTSTATRTATSTPTSTLTATPTKTSTPTNSPTATPTFTSTPTNTSTPTISPTPTVTLTPSNTPTGTLMPTDTATATSTPTNSATLTSTPSSSPTATATPSQLQEADANGDGIVNVEDYVVVGQHWLQTGPPGTIPGDVNRDGVVNIEDYIIIGAHWMETTGLPTATPTATP